MFMRFLITPKSHENGSKISSKRVSSGSLPGLIGVAKARFRSGATHI